MNATLNQSGLKKALLGREKASRYEGRNLTGVGRESHGYSALFGREVLDVFSTEKTSYSL